MRFTRALPALPTSSSTWPISRRSAPFTGAKISLGRRATTRRRAFLGAAFFGVAFFFAALRVATPRAVTLLLTAARGFETRRAERAERFLAIVARMLARYGCVGFRLFLITYVAIERPSRLPAS